MFKNSLFCPKKLKRQQGVSMKLTKVFNLIKLINFKQNQNKSKGICR